MEVKRAIEDFVNNLNNPREYLLENGYKGYRGDPCHCPLARCLLDEFIKDNDEGWDSVDVGPVGIFIKKYENFYVNAMKTPEHIRRFLDDFDNGDYPELELERTTEGTYLQKGFY